MVPMPFAPAAAAFIVALFCLWALLASTRLRRLAIDHPNERSLHERPVPRTGGLAIVAGVAAASALGGPAPWTALAFAAALGVVSFADDLLGLPRLARLGAHLAAAAGVLAAEISLRDPVFFAILVLAIAWYANLYNFMDGSDGLAGGMTVIGFGAYAIAAHSAGAQPIAGASAAVAAAAAAFLLFNFHPARIFMGDVGSVPLGFLAGAFGVLGWREGVWPLWFPLLVFAPFVCDATLTLLRRLARGERIWRAHREHYYQRLVRMGFGHRGTAYIEYAAMLGCAAAALYARDAAPGMQAATLAGAALVLLAIAVWVDLRWRRAIH